jgi:hypothetical protein
MTQPEQPLPPRVARELRTVQAMIDAYCEGVHGSTGGLCEECRELAQYAEKRLQKCPFEEDKPTCANCPIHCYMPKRREQIKTVMRYAGPRMIFKHPIFAIRHWIDGMKKAPEHPSRARQERT